MKEKITKQLQHMGLKRKADVEFYIVKTSGKINTYY